MEIDVIRILLGTVAVALLIKVQNHRKPTHLVLQSFSNHGYEVRQNQNSVFIHIVDKELYESFIESKKDLAIKRLLLDLDNETRTN